VLTIRRDLVDAMVAHARRDHPVEACGVLPGPAGSDRPERFVRMANVAGSKGFEELDPKDRYVFDSNADLRLYKELDDNGEERVVIYHSHTHSEAYPSPTDITRAWGYPDAHYVLVSTRDPDTHELRSYRIIDGEVSEEPIEVVESYMFSHTGADDVPDAH
jgi:proteasome lid subunit RPN8/RPN11